MLRSSITQGERESARERESLVSRVYGLGEGGRERERETAKTTTRVFAGCCSPQARFPKEKAWGLRVRGLLRKEQ